MDSESNDPDEKLLYVQQLFISEQPQLRAFVCSLAPNFSVADDVIQETFLEVSRKAHDFERGTNFWGWVRRIARFKLLSQIRDHQRRPFVSLSEEVLDALIASAPEQRSHDHESKLTALRKCLKRLAPQARELVRLRYFSEHPPSEIAELRNQSVNAISVTLSRSRETLRQCVAKTLSSS